VECWGERIWLGITMDAAFEPAGYSLSITEGAPNPSRAIAAGDGIDGGLAPFDVFFLSNLRQLLLPPGIGRILSDIHLQEPVSLLLLLNVKNQFQVSFSSFPI